MKNIFFLIILFFLIKITWVFLVFWNFEEQKYKKYWYWYWYDYQFLEENFLEKTQKIIFKNQKIKFFKEKIDKIFLEKLVFLENLEDKNNIKILKQKYFLLFDTLKKFEDKKIKEDEVKKQFLDFYNFYLKTEEKVEKIWYFTKVENTIFYIPYFKNESVNKKIKSFNKCYLKEELKNKTNKEKKDFSIKYFLKLKNKLSLNK